MPALSSTGSTRQPVRVNSLPRNLLDHFKFHENIG